MMPHAIPQERGIRIELEVEGPLLVKSSSSSGFGLDASMATVKYGPQKESPYIPGTLLKGKLAEALEAFHRLTPEAGFGEFRKDWLGQASGDDIGSNDATVDPYRGRLIFDDLVATKPVNTTVRHRVRLDAGTGTAVGQMLQSVESPVASGERMKFVGHAWFVGGDPKVVRSRVELALSFLTQLGAHRTTGFGRLVGVQVDLEEEKEPGEKDRNELSIVPSRSQGPVNVGIGALGTEQVSYLRLALKPLGPIAIARHKIGDNLYVSDSIIPGNVIAGALTETWAAFLGKRVPKTGVARNFDPTRPELGAHFAHLRFRHAFPGKGQATRPRTVPLSLVSVGRSAYRDFASQACAVLFSTADGQPLAPAFRVDWKGEDFGKIDPAFGWEEPARELRVRTAIDSKYRRADRGSPDEAEGQLFAQELVHPYSLDGEPLVWHGGIGLVDVPEDDRAQVASQLAEVLSVLSYLGKTKARCVVKVTAGAAPACPVLRLDQELRLVLETPALLADPRFQEVSQVPKSGAIPRDALRRLYASTWQELSDGALELSHFFATQALAGGQYLYRRFQCRKAARGKCIEYRPWLLTEPGSVFSFRVRDPELATERLRAWQERGLPLPRWAAKAFGSRWDTNPFIPNNGFGEIRVHEFMQEFPRPGASEVIPIPFEEEAR